jgi:hypothetical protein
VKPVVRAERVQFGTGSEGQPRVRFGLNGDARPRQQKMCVVGYCPADVFAIGALQGQIGIADRVDALIVPFGGGKLRPQAITDVADAENPRRVQNGAQHVARGARVITRNSRAGRIIETVFLWRDGGNVLAKPRFVAGARQKPQFLELRAMFGVELLNGEHGDIVVLRKHPGRGGLEFACRTEKENHQELQSSNSENF